MDKKYDVIIWGASGFTGRLVAEYLNNQYGTDGDLKWAMAGRNQQKLEKVRSELGNNSIPIVTGDSMDMDSLNNMVQQTKVMCTTVGPYAKYGSNLVESCINNGTDYCDLTGEVQWIRKMIDQHHEAAKAKGVKIVHCCGFDSIPSDMGVFFLQKAAINQRAQYCKEVKLGVKAFKGGMSGGTIASLKNVMTEAKEDPSIFGTLQNPYGLNPAGQMEGPDSADLNTIEFDDDFNAWKSPFIMAAINTKIVRRSHALSGHPYGEDFKYSETSLHVGADGKQKAKRNASRMAMISGGKSGPIAAITKSIVNLFLPKPGQGPNKKQRETGFFNMAILGKYADGGTIQGKITGDRDPGYGSTSKMLGEAAVCLAKDHAFSPYNYGVLTPSVAMGNSLLKRLKDFAGLTFELADGEKEVSMA